MSEPLFDKIALIGIGLIGGSIALEARKRGLARSIVAATRSAETAALASKLKLADHCGTDLAAAARDADLVIVCTPVGACGPATEAIAASLKPGCIVSDVGSVKQTVIAARKAGAIRRKIEEARAALQYTLKHKCGVDSVVLTPGNHTEALPKFLTSRMSR